ncbi:MAG: thymidylate synthase [Methanobacterium formicicum]|jgi:thymidylate synthase|uniref:Putative thymidylate synthase n=1 Tax=Methanobacterium formicicum TaxID=2162 RepID=A0A090I8N8_METFO|nr:MULTISPECIES: thymidylate synthase [Methanobacterium]AIS32562.1 thymidylate synthase ThyA [Methanobacterium formicicum]MDD4809648.1 thymidylate synthase [Methanobacterium formicicum]MDG3546420.1 thymidylate synthase [Methanobacterium formicicum]MDH2659630.1 thymidylate synthase [Methanobacterium formicicum]CEA14822.1 putative thymidylate synthase [Methanobacterium formicicum]
MAILIKTPTIKSGWETLVKRVMEKGAEIKDERGSLTLEIRNTVVNIKRPLELEIPKGYFWSGEKLEIYAEQFLSDDKQGFVYTYGNRLRGHFEGIDQIGEAIRRLKNCRESRRAISVTWDPTTDTKNEEVPCMILVDFKIRDGKLHTTGLWRSHDIYGAWFPNAVGLTHLAKYVAEEVGVEVGSLTIHSISAHIYQVNFEEALRV